MAWQHTGLRMSVTTRLDRIGHDQIRGMLFSRYKKKSIFKNKQSPGLRQSLFFRFSFDFIVFVQFDSFKRIHVCWISDSPMIIIKNSKIHVASVIWKKSSFFLMSVFKSLLAMIGLKTFFKVCIQASMHGIDINSRDYWIKLTIQFFD